MYGIWGVRYGDYTYVWCCYQAVINTVTFRRVPQSKKKKDSDPILIKCVSRSLIHAPRIHMPLTSVTSSPSPNPNPCTGTPSRHCVVLTTPPPLKNMPMKRLGNTMACRTMRNFSPVV
jgi:hypothetical protein